MPKLTVKQIEAITIPGRYSDGGGLYIEVDKTMGKRWLFRYQLNGKRTTHGLGGYHSKSNTLAMARAKAIDCKSLVNKGIHPGDAAEAARQKQKTSQEQKKIEIMTFEKCAREWYERNQAGWTNSKHRQQVINTLSTYAFPFIGKLPVGEISIKEIKRCLDPIWDVKTETANRLRQRLEAVFSYSIVNGYRTSQNPAQWKGYLDNIYVNPEKLKRDRHVANDSDGHMKALSFDSAPEFIKKLREIDTVSARALELTVLTASRTKPTRHMTWEQLNLEERVWTVPASLMKTKKAFRVALSEQATALLNQMPRADTYVFAGSKAGQPISENTMLTLLKRMGYVDLTVHGFRSTFRDWVGEATEFDTQLAEYALAHRLPDATERAYARGDQLEKRFGLMDAWGTFLTKQAK